MQTYHLLKICVLKAVEWTSSNQRPRNGRGWGLVLWTHLKMWTGRTLALDLTCIHSNKGHNLSGQLLIRKALHLGQCYGNNFQCIQLRRAFRRPFGWRVVRQARAAPTVMAEVQLTNNDIQLPRLKTFSIMIGSNCSGNIILCVKNSAPVPPPPGKLDTCTASYLYF